MRTRLCTMISDQRHLQLEIPAWPFPHDRAMNKQSQRPAHPKFKKTGLNRWLRHHHRIVIFHAAWSIINNPSLVHESLIVHIEYAFFCQHKTSKRRSRNQTRSGPSSRSTRKYNTPVNQDRSIYDHQSDEKKIDSPTKPFQITFRHSGKNLYP